MTLEATIECEIGGIMGSQVDLSTIEKTFETRLLQLVLTVLL